MSLRAHSIDVDRGPRSVLRGVELSVEPGRLLAVVGPSGAGKSTLVAALAGELEPSRGEVTLDGRPARSIAPEALARRRAVLTQDPSDGFGYSALAIALMGRAPYIGAWPGPLDVRRARCALAWARADHLAERRVASLSGGERRRVHFARALAQLDFDGDRPGYLLLDEPASGLDAAAAHDLLDRARSVARAGHGVLAVLHDLDLAARFADSIAMIDATGRLAALGAPADVLTSPRLAAVFGLRADVIRAPGDGRPVLITRGTTSAPPATMER